MTMDEIEGGIRIKHEGLDGQVQIIEVEYDEKAACLLLMVDGKQVQLDMGETGYFLATMSWWYDKGGD